jgi:GNAT superfamily N-acetyltransferase
MADLQARLRSVLDPVEAADDVEADWGPNRIRVRAYLGAYDVPDELVRSVRCTVLRGGEVLLLRNRNGLRHVVPGGRREPGEAQLAALERELLEETGWTVRAPRLFGLLRITFLNERPDAAPFYPEFAQQVYVGAAAEHRPDACAGEEYEVECVFRPVSEALALTLEPGNAALLRAATAVRVRPSAEADLAAYVALRNRAYGDNWLTEDEAHNLAERAARGGLALRRLVAEDAAGQLLGFAMVMGRERCRLDVGVEPTARRRGIGELLWRAALAELRAVGATAVHSSWFDATAQEAWRFLSKRGFVEAQRAYGSELDLAELDPARFAELEARLAAEGVLFEPLPTDREALRRVHALHEACRMDQPGETRRPIPFEEWLVAMVDAPGALPDGWVLARQGDAYVGLTVLDARGGEPACLHQGFTGVLPSHRGRGIATALKVRAAAWARGRGYRRIRTDNSCLNGAMLKVNEKIGFRRVSERVSMERVLRG